MASRLLVIEDDLFTRDLYQEVLRDEGFDVTVARDGEEGLEKLKTGGWDLTLMDVMMPKKNGLDVLIALSETKAEQPNGPIILLTNLARDPILKDALKFGATACLIKTDLDPQQLIVKVKSFLQEKPSVPVTG